MLSSPATFAAAAAAARRALPVLMAKGALPAAAALVRKIARYEALAAGEGP